MKSNLEIEDRWLYYRKGQDGFWIYPAEKKRQLYIVTDRWQNFMDVINNEKRLIASEYCDEFLFMRLMLRASNWNGKRAVEFSK
jgi:hypothetical protein